MSANRIFHPQEEALLLDFFGMQRPAELRDLEVHASEHVDDDAKTPVLVEPNADGEHSELGLANAVARLALSRVQDRLPQWGVVDADGNVELAREHRASKARQVDLLPQFLFNINWADSGPGFSWPESYHAAFVPGFGRYVVTASADGTDAYGYADIAIGWFEDEETLLEGSKRVILKWWQEYRDHDHEGWVYLFSTGIVGEEEALRWKEEVWPTIDVAKEAEEEERRLAPFQTQIGELISRITAEWPQPTNQAMRIGRGICLQKLRNRIEQYVLEHARVPRPKDLKSAE